MNEVRHPRQPFMYHSRPSSPNSQNMVPGNGPFAGSWEQAEDIKPDKTPPRAARRQIPSSPNVTILTDTNESASKQVLRKTKSQRSAKMSETDEDLLEDDDKTSFLRTRMRLLSDSSPPPSRSKPSLQLANSAGGDTVDKKLSGFGETLSTDGEGPSHQAPSAYISDHQRRVFQQERRDQKSVSTNFVVSPISYYYYNIICVSKTPL